MYLLVICLSSLDKHLLKSFVHFKKLDHLSFYVEL